MKQTYLRDPYGHLVLHTPLDLLQLILQVVQIL